MPDPADSFSKVTADLVSLASTAMTQALNSDKHLRRSRRRVLESTIEKTLKRKRQSLRSALSWMNK